MDRLKFRAKLLKEILDGKNIVRNMWELFSENELPDFILGYYLQIGIINVKEDISIRRENTLIVKAFEKNRDEVKEWMESMKLYSDCSMSDYFKNRPNIEEHDVDIERSYIMHLEALAGMEANR